MYDSITGNDKKLRTVNGFSFCNLDVASFE